MIEWTVFMQGIIMVAVNAVVTYLVQKHLIKGLYEKKIRGMLRRKRK